MANIKSSKKDALRSRKRRARNLATRTQLKSTIVKTRTAIRQGDAAAAAELTRKAGRLLDKAASKGAIHKRQAARRKSRVARQAAKLASADSA